MTRIEPGAAVNVADYERLAAERLDPATYGYFAGGAGDEWTLRENVAAFRRWLLRPRVLAEVGDVTTETTVLGTSVSMPLLVAPVAFQRLVHDDAEPGMARAAAAVGTVMCLSTMATSLPAEVAQAARGAPLWYQLYVFRDAGVTREIVGRAVDAGVAALVLTADTPYLGRRERDLRSGFKLPDDLAIPALDAARRFRATEPVYAHFELVSASLSWRDVEELASSTGLPVLVKGVLTAEDARLACEHGAVGVIVSNHGGRQLDGVPAALDALPEVVEAVDGRAEVLVDGGIRRGTDVLKALALGARAALAGRAPLWGLAADGERGAQRVLELLRDEIRLGLALLGCTSPDRVGRAHVASTAEA